QVASSPGAPPLNGIEGLRLRPGKYTYRIVDVDSVGTVKYSGDAVIAISPDARDRTPLWRAELSIDRTLERGQRSSVVETLYVTRRDLRPVARMVHERPYLHFSAINITQRFVGDSVFGEMTTDGGIRRPVAGRLPAGFGPYVSDPIAPLAL